MPEWASWQMPSSVNPTLAPSELDEMRRTMPERTYRQEIEAAFVEDGGGVFRRVQEAATAEPQSVRRGDSLYICGIDWALNFDFSVVTVIDVKRREMVYMDRFNGVDYTMQRDRIKAICDRFAVSGIIAEQNGLGGPNNEALRRMGLPVRDFTTTNSTKADIIESLAAAFEQGNIRILNDATLIAELQAYEVQRLPSGMVRYTAPDSMHDDCVVSLALAWHGASSASRRRARATEY